MLRAQAYYGGTILLVAAHQEPPDEAEEGNPRIPKMARTISVSNGHVSDS